MTSCFMKHETYLLLYQRFLEFLSKYLMHSELVNHSGENGLLGLNNPEKPHLITTAQQTPNKVQQVKNKLLRGMDIFAGDVMSSKIVLLVNTGLL